MITKAIRTAAVNWQMSISSSNLPPLASNGVFAVSSSILIDAPRDKVWSVLLDFRSYKEWNAFVRGQNIVDKSGNPLADQTPAVGQFLLIYPVHLPPTMGEPTAFFQKQSASVVITTVDHENFRAAWVTTFVPKFLLATERWQALSVDADGKTKYETIEVFSGLLAYFIKFFMRGKLVLGFDAMAEGLKKRSEQVEESL